MSKDENQAAQGGDLGASTMINDLFSMRGQVCVVTGGSTGLGSYMARGFLAAGAARVYIIARSVERLEATAAELSGVAAGECIALPGDLLSSGIVEKLAQELREREDHIDVLVNNAGKGSLDTFGEAVEEHWDSTMVLNLRTPFFLTQALHGLLTHRATAENPSRVISTSSVGASGSFPYVYSYGASKAALEQLTRSLANRLVDDHILVNAIAPGLFVSEMTARQTRDLGADHEKQLLEKLPLHRYGKMEDIAGVAIMLCSRAGAYFTGEVLNVDGGYRLVY
jgi:NAD(P)-dependent dehydrogenase (short-subunit alcohol dehydrogenase family)